VPITIARLDKDKVPGSGIALKVPVFCAEKEAKVVPFCPKAAVTPEKLSARLA
jgi:hypothetical protein